MNLTKGFDPVRMLFELRTKSEEYWIKRGEKMALRLFYAMAEGVPAYTGFLKENGINNYTKIKDIKAFKKLPTISKDNYLKRHSLNELCWDGNFETHWDISSTSGSTGEPFYFPRSDEQNQQYARSAELYLLNNFEIDKRSTLYINCFALGVWIGGMFTYAAIKLVARRGQYKLSIINPGLNKGEIIKAVSKLGGLFDQIIIAGYPPFVKDVIDEGVYQNLNWADYAIKFIFSAETFSEEFRDYIYAKTRTHHVFKDSISHYGTVDQGTLAHETPLTILIRRLCLKNRELFGAVFTKGIRRLPTLVQYVPEFFYFEEVEGSLLCTSRSGLPLVRYDLKDNGGVRSFEEMKNIFKILNIDFLKEAEKVGILHTIWNLPFVFIYERKDLSVSFCGANIYPETIRNVLSETEFLEYLTGKFVLMVKHDAKQNPHLEIQIEMKKDVFLFASDLYKKLTFKIVDRLLSENSEYRSVHYDQKQEKAVPRLVFWPYESPEYFKTVGKQKWVLKN